LGGSFNPAHEGHRHISLIAMAELGLDQVWWLVSPQNPLKPVEGMEGFDTRLSGARAAARHPRILVTDLERRLGTRYTADTLAVLKCYYPRTHFVWLMGADNLGQIHRWQRWRTIFRNVPVAVFDRPAYGLRALTAPAAQTYRASRVSQSRAGLLARRRSPGWVFFACRLETQSSTAIRQAKRRVAP
jgi:nicotinate-nucleotide adenylyltransferase